MAANIPTYGPNGVEFRPWTEYVYIWICATPSGQRAKVGVTSNPRRRFASFRTSCPFDAFGTYICQAPSREVALRLESRILGVFASFSAHGEWIVVPYGKNDKFVAACTKLARNVIDDDAFFRETPMFRRKKKSFRRTASAALTW
jgi:hypothetical protein